MASTLVDTKLYRPRPRRGLVVRSRLTDRLDRAGEARLTLVSAPAGFGKTTAVVAWLAGRPPGDGVAWVSLDEGDARPATFWTYLVTALQGVAPAVGAAVLAQLPSGPAPSEAVLTVIVNELAQVERELYLVLDDYHLADGPQIAAGMTFLVQHLPPQVHLVIATRADPDLPLARLRARGDLVEVRAADLRFTVDETAAYLSESAGLDVPADAVRSLELRTEGWVAALQLAGLSLQGRSDPAAFVERFAGDDRYIVDYLVEEVLSRQPEQLRAFLVQTSVLDRLGGELCEAVTGQSGARSVLAQLERQNLFVVPMDDGRHWYRYHHLFADVLQAHLHQERPGEVAELHRRAAQWFEQAGEWGTAVRHALAAGDVEHAADLVEQTLPMLRRDRQEAAIRAWIEALPEATVRCRPVLTVGLIGALMAGNDFADVEARLRDVEPYLPALRSGGPLPPDIVVVNADEAARLPAGVEMYRAALALIHGNLTATVGHAEQATALAPEDDVIPASAAALAGLAHWTSGDLEPAHRCYLDSLEGLRRAGHHADVLGCTIAVADIRIALGQPDEALASYRSGLRLAAAHADPVLRGTPDMHVGIAQIALSSGDLDTARAELDLAQQLGEAFGLPQFPYRWRATLASLREAEGDLVAARELLDQAQQVYVGDFSPDVRPLAARLARVQLAAGDLDAARRWADARGLAATDDVSYLREFEHLTLVRLLLAEHAAGRRLGALGEAASLLDRLLASAEAGRRGSVREIRDLRGQVASADDRRAAPSVAAGGPIDPLSARELEVLRLLGTDLDGPEIARHLVVSVNTVRTHIRRIFVKLGVRNRRAAVRRAEELGLLG